MRLRTGSRSASTVRPAVARRRRAAAHHGDRDPPYISGQPFRIKYLEEIYAHINRHAGVLHMNGEEIYRWYNGLKKVHV